MLGIPGPRTRGQAVIYLVGFVAFGLCYAIYADPRAADRIAVTLVHPAMAGLRAFFSSGAGSFLLLLGVAVLGGVYTIATAEEERDPLDVALERFRRDPMDAALLDELVASSGAERAPELAAALDRDLDAGRAIHLVALLANLGHPSVLARLLDAAGSTHPGVRGAALRALGRSTAPEAEARLVRELADGDEAGRLAALDALRGRDCQGAREVIERLLAGGTLARSLDDRLREGLADLERRGPGRLVLRSDDDG
jgi:hypothetical protein